MIRFSASYRCSNIIVTTLITSPSAPPPCIPPFDHKTKLYSPFKSLYRFRETFLLLNRPPFFVIPFPRKRSSFNTITNLEGQDVRVDERTVSLAETPTKRHGCSSKERRALPHKYRWSHHRASSSRPAFLLSGRGLPEALPSPGGHPWTASKGGTSIHAVRILRLSELLLCSAHRLYGWSFREDDRLVMVHTQHITTKCTAGFWSQMKLLFSTGRNMPPLTLKESTRLQ